MKINKFFLNICIFSILLFLFLPLYNSYLMNGVNIKCAKDYLPSDYVKTKNIILKNKIPSNELLKKCDINEDGKITNYDLETIKQMICKDYDYYVIKDETHMIIKFINKY